jgi:hypothetical protein
MQRMVDSHSPIEAINTLIRTLVEIWTEAEAIRRGEALSQTPGR